MLLYWSHTGHKVTPKVLTACTFRLGSHWPFSNGLWEVGSRREFKNLNGGGTQQAYVLLPVWCDSFLSLRGSTGTDLNTKEKFISKVRLQLWHHLMTGYGSGVEEPTSVWVRALLKQTLELSRCQVGPPISLQCAGPKFLSTVVISMPWKSGRLSNSLCTM